MDDKPRRERNREHHHPHPHPHPYPHLHPHPHPDSQTHPHPHSDAHTQPQPQPHSHVQSQPHRKEKRSDARSQGFNRQESSPQRYSPSTSHASPKTDFTEKKPEKPRSIRDRAAEKTDKPQSLGDRAAEKTDKPQSVGDRAAEKTDKPQSVGDRAAEKTEKSQSLGDRAIEKTQKPQSLGDRAIEKTQKPQSLGDRAAEKTEKPQNLGDRAAEKTEKPQGIGDRAAEKTEKPQNLGDRAAEKTDKPQGLGDRAAEKTDIEELKTSKKSTSLEDSVKSNKDSTTHPKLGERKVSKPGRLPPLDVERICLGEDFSNITCDTSNLLFSESLIQEIKEKGKVLTIEDEKTRAVIQLGPTKEEKLEKCSKQMLRTLKKRSKNIIKEKYNCHKQWRAKKKELKKLKKQEDEQKVWMLKNLDTPLSKEDDLRTKRALLDFYYHILQTFLISIIAMSMMSSEMYFFSNQTVVLFFDEITISPDSNETRNSTGIEQKRTLRDSRSINDFWAFAENSLLNLLYSNLYNSYLDPKTHTEKDDAKDMYPNQILGVARIRQVRVTNTSCKIHPEMERFFRNCYFYYNVFSESTIPIRNDMGGSSTATAWNYTDYKKLQASFYCGEISCYGGGGYYLDLAKDKESSAEKLKELRENDWVSESTRAVFIDFTIYNANANLFCICKILVEMPPTGGILPMSDFNAMKLIRYLSALDFFILALEAIYLLLIVYLTCREIYKIHLEKIFYFMNPWNYVQMIILLLSYAFFFFDIARFLYIQSLIQEVDNNYYTYTDFESAKTLQQFFNSLLAILVFASWVRLFSYFNFTTNMLRLQRTLARSLFNMLMFIPMFLTMITAFSIVAYLLFGQQVKEYNSPWRAFLTLVQAFLGEFNCTYILETNRILGPIFYIVFVFFVFFVLLNVFIAIISEAYTSVMSVAYGNTPDHGNYLCRAFVNTFTCCRPRMKVKHLNSSLRKKLLFKEIESALKRAGFRDKEIKIFFHKYEINYMNFLDEKTRSKMAMNLNLKEFEINATSEQYQIDVLKKKYNELRSMLELLDTKLQPVIDKVDIIVHRL